MMTDEDWVKAVFQQANGEIPQAFNQLHSNINWALGLVSLILTGVIIAGRLDLITFGVTFFALIMVIGFFVRSCLGFVNLSRWNMITSAVSDYLNANDADKAIYLAKLKLIYEAYISNWYSPLPRKKAILSNAKFFRFWSVFVAIIIALLYQPLYLNENLGGISTSNTAGVLTIFALGLIAILYEISSLYDGPYFKYVYADRNSINAAKAREKLKDPKTRRYLAYAGVITVLLVVVLFTAGTQTGEQSYTSQALGTVGNYYVIPLPNATGSLVTVHWQSSSLVMVGAIVSSHLPDLNASRLEAATSLELGTDGTLHFLVTVPSYFFVAKSQIALVNVSYSGNSIVSNYAILFLFTFGIAIAVASVIWKARLEKNSDVLPERKQPS